MDISMDCCRICIDYIISYNIQIQRNRIDSFINFYSYFYSSFRYVLLLVACFSQSCFVYITIPIKIVSSIVIEVVLWVFWAFFVFLVFFIIIIIIYIYIYIFVILSLVKIFKLLPILYPISYIRYYNFIYVLLFFSI